MQHRSIAIEIDASVTLGPVDRSWRYIGYDENNYTHTPEGEELLGKLGAMEATPCYIRTHHMLCTGNLHGVYKWGSTNVYTEDADGNPVYCWETVDRILDVLLRHNCKPFFELGFMPFHLVDPKCFTGMWDGKKYDEYKRLFWAYPPKDYEKWQDLIEALVRHCVDRYGETEVLTWYWELWNEPDIFYWQGTKEEFFRLFDHTETAIHRVLKMARLGGPGTTDPNPGSASLKFLEAFLTHCRGGQHAVTGQTGTRLDFITFHTKGGGFPFKLNAEKETPSIHKQIAQVETGLQAMARYGYGSLEVVLSEADPDGWAAGGIHDNPNMKFRNTAYYASYVACGYHHIEKLAQKWNTRIRPLAWAFLFRGERCFEGTRTFSTQGIDKPVLNVFRLFAKKGTHQLSLTSSAERNLAVHPGPSGTDEAPDVSGMATRTENGELQVFLYSHHDDWDRDDTTVASLTIFCTGFFGSAASVSVAHHRIDHNHSNAHTVWQALGSPEYPTTEQMASMKARDGLELVEEIQALPLENERITLTVEMPAHAVSMLEISPASR